MAGTITLSGVEQVSVIQHLEVRHAALARGDPESIMINSLIVRIGEGRTVNLAAREAYTMLRHLRYRHQEIDNDMLALEERRLRGGFDGQLDAAHRILDAELQILADVLRRLWMLL